MTAYTRLGFLKKKRTDGAVVPTLKKRWELRWQVSKKVMYIEVWKGWRENKKGQDAIVDNKENRWLNGECKGLLGNSFTTKMRLNSTECETPSRRKEGFWMHPWKRIEGFSCTPQRRKRVSECTPRKGKRVSECTPQKGKRVSGHCHQSGQWCFKAHWYTHDHGAVTFTTTKSGQCIVVKETWSQESRLLEVQGANYSVSQMCWGLLF